MTIACVAFAATAATAQHLWKPPVKTSGTMDAIRPITLRPQAISVGANGIYCPDMSEGAVGVHDLGWLPAGLNVVVTVESSTTTASFDPVAAVIVAAVGEGAGNTVRPRRSTTTIRQEKECARDLRGTSTRDLPVARD
jgi:hypothetical protein